MAGSQWLPLLGVCFPLGDGLQGISLLFSHKWAQSLDALSKLLERTSERQSKFGRYFRVGPWHAALACKNARTISLTCCAIVPNRRVPVRDISIVRGKERIREGCTVCTIEDRSWGRRSLESGPGSRPARKTRSVLPIASERQRSSCSTGGPLYVSLSVRASDDVRPGCFPGDDGSRAGWPWRWPRRRWARRRPRGFSWRLWVWRLSRLRLRWLLPGVRHRDLPRLRLWWLWVWLRLPRLWLRLSTALRWRLCTCHRDGAVGQSGATGSATWRARDATWRGRWAACRSGHAAYRARRPSRRTGRATCRTRRAPNGSRNAARRARRAATRTAWCAAWWSADAARELEQRPESTAAAHR